MLAQVWRYFCLLVTWTFYRKVEVHEPENLPMEGPVILCANHPSALVDALVIQSVLPRILHPLARSGLFKNPLIRPFLMLNQAVPVYRRQETGLDKGTDMGKTRSMFARVHKMLAEGRAMLIFPEGESHSSPSMKALKTGAARIALEAPVEARPTFVPVGLNFSRVGRFRGSVLVIVGKPFMLEAQAGEAGEEAARRCTEEIRTSLEAVTLNLESWRDLDLMRRLERFFSMRQGKYRSVPMHKRFNALKRISEGLARLRNRDKEKLEKAERHLKHFERLCRHMGIRDYHLSIQTPPVIVFRFLLRSLLFLGLGMPVALWGGLNGFLPYRLTGMIAPRISKDRYQYETAQVGVGFGLYSFFWGGQTLLIFYFMGLLPALIYGLTLLPSAAIALYVRRERTRILEDGRAFMLFLRKKELKEMMRTKRKQLEKELASLVRASSRGHS